MVHSHQAQDLQKNLHFHVLLLTLYSARNLPGEWQQFTRRKNLHGRQNTVTSLNLLAAPTVSLCFIWQKFAFCPARIATSPDFSSHSSWASLYIHITCKLSALGRKIASAVDKSGFFCIRVFCHCHIPRLAAVLNVLYSKKMDFKTTKKLPHKHTRSVDGKLFLSNMTAVFSLSWHGVNTYLHASKWQFNKNSLVTLIMVNDQFF